MKKNRTWFGGIIIALSALMLMSHSNFVTANAAVKLSKSSQTLIVGDRIRLELKGTSAKVKWKSSNASVVKVSSTGSCLAKKKGSAKVTATYGKKSKSCKFVVNKTFGMNVNSISISKDSKIKLTFTGNGAIKSSRANTKICKVTFGEWSGDDLNVTITPLKVGSTTVTFSNTGNKETCVLKVNVKALPKSATFAEPEISTGAKDFIVSENTARYTFRLNQNAADTKFVVYNHRGNAIRTISLGNVTAKKNVSVLWDGKTDEGKTYEGLYSFGVDADGDVTKSGTSYRIRQTSPFGSGDGSDILPYLVSDKKEFRMMPDYDGEGVCFALDQDINFEGESTGEMFTNHALAGSITGTYGGIKHTVYNVLGAPKSAGSDGSNAAESGTLIGNISATGSLTNMVVRDVMVTGTTAVVALKSDGSIRNVELDAMLLCNQVGLRAGMLVDQNAGVISGCNVSGSMTVSMINLVAAVNMKIGGVAAINKGRITSCQSDCIISARMIISQSPSTVVEAGTYAVYAGGVAGENANVGIISACVFQGEIYADSTGDANKVGGICGLNNGITTGCSFNATDNVRSSQGAGNGD